MNNTKKVIKLFLRLAIALGFFSAVLDRFGFWGVEVSAWGNWDSFLAYTQLINPFIPTGLIPIVGIAATSAEIIFGLCLIIGYKTELFAIWSGFLLLIFALAMTFSTGIKGVFDYSVFTASAAAFALGMMEEKYLELDLLLLKPDSKT
jgi:thiosulfate dehydrogenase [quinone] large subunit